MLFYIGLIVFIIAAIVVVLMATEAFGFLGIICSGFFALYLGNRWFFSHGETTGGDTITEPLTTGLTPMLEFLATDIALTFLGIVLFGLLVFFAETEQLLSSVIAIVVAAVGLQWLTDISVFTWMAENPVSLIALIVGYVVVGIGFTLFWDWPKYCKANANPSELKEYLDTYPESDEDEFFNSSYVNSLHPQNHISRLGNMVFHWPFSLFWTLLHDPITWLYNFLYSLLGDVFLGIAKKATQAAVNASKPK